MGAPDERGGLGRRTLLKAGLAAAGALVAGPTRAAEPRCATGQREWQNWSGSEGSCPRQWLAPHDEKELATQLRAVRGTVRVTGASHSFSGLCTTDDTLLSLDRMTGIVSHDPARQRATVWAGTRLRDLGEPLWQLGQALVNQGDVNPQSVAGACGTSTHGTGIRLGSFSSMVRGVRLLTAAGDLVEADADRDADVLAAAGTSLGTLGILTQITLQNRATYQLAEREFTEDLEEVLRQLDDYRTQNRHFEFWTFFRSERAIVKLLNESDAAPTPPDTYRLPVDAALRAACEIAHRVPSLDGAMQRLLTALHSDSERVGRAYEIFPSPRTVRFNEMEYEVPLTKGPDCLREILAAVRDAQVNTLFPIEYRHVAADDVWLSPFYGRDSAAISVHQYHRVDPKPLFAIVEPILRRYQGRPHWGKMHTLTAKELAPLYPRWDDFQRVRRRLDPSGRFLNDHLRRVLGVVA